jgi:hypothetical protein
MADDRPTAGAGADERPDYSRSATLGWLFAFGRFWREFLIGDTPELFVGVVAIIGLLAVICLKPGLRTVAAFVAPVLVAGLLTASVYRAVRNRAS